MKDRTAQGKDFGKGFSNPAGKGKVKPPRPDPPIEEPPDETPLPPPPLPALNERVLVVFNRNSVQSIALADTYCLLRAVPERNRLPLDWRPGDNEDRCTLPEFQNLILNPILSAAARLTKIDYVVMCRNLPDRLNWNGIHGQDMSVDSQIAAGKWTDGRYIENGYFGNTEADFVSGRFGNTKFCPGRLDGWRWDDAYNLAQRGQAKLPDMSAPYYFDCDPGRGSTGANYDAYNKLMKLAAEAMRALGATVIVEETADYGVPPVPVAGYAGWGKNDYQFNMPEYSQIRFAPGAYVDMLYSLSAINLRYPGNVCQISQLAQQGVMAAHGYIAEPYLNTAGKIGVAFPALLKGQTIGEAVLGSCPYIGWKDVLLGDPLARPYATG